MNEKKPTLQECAMRYGTIMGLFWAFIAVLIPVGIMIPILQIVFLILVLFVPILGYIFAKRYRIAYCDNVISFGQAFSFTMSMYMFAALLVSIVHYVYFQYIDNGFLFKEYLNIFEQSKKIYVGKENHQMINQLIEGLKQNSTLSSIEITFQLITNNLFYGLLMALPTAAIVKRKK